MGEEVSPDQKVLIFLCQSLEDGKNWFPHGVYKSIVPTKAGLWLNRPFFRRMMRLAADTGIQKTMKPEDLRV